MLTCSRCGWVVGDAHARVCPNCGLALQQAGDTQAGAPAPTSGAQPPAEQAPSGPTLAPVIPPGPQVYGPPPTYGAPPSMPAPPAYGAPPTYPQAPVYGAPPAYGAPPTYPQPPVYGAPPSMPMPPTYGAPPTYPAPPSMPMPPTYGAPPSMPAPGGPTYGTGYGGQSGYPGGYVPGQNWRPSEGPAPRPWGRIIGAIFGVVILIAIVVSVAYNVTRPKAPPVKLTAAQVTQTAASASTILSDPLTTNEHGWTDDGNRCYFGTDGYHIRNSTICLAPIGSQTDGTESVTAKEISGSADHGHGLVFRFVSEGNYYEFLITSGGDYGVFRFKGGMLTALVPYTPSSSINEGLNNANTLSVTMKGSDIDCYINGIKITEVHDSTFLEGQWGMGVHSTDNVVYTDYLARYN